ncbi:MAG TPA: DinB family protein [Longimicrobiaceae bacterium]|nr:DinB family protein [Longimicrobiaceae bacterium]
MLSTATAFPAEYRAYSTPHLLAVFARAPERLRAAVADLSPDELRARPRPEKWSVAEIVCHLADSELMGAGRIRMVVAQSGPEFVSYDQDAFAAALGYRDDPPAFARALRLFELLRESTLAVFARTEAETWERWGVHPDFGPVTLRNLLELYADHGERHLGQILAIRAQLGKPLDVRLLLEQRLY